MSFSELGLAPELLQAVTDCGYETPTPIQAQAIPPLLSGRDLMGCAQTGTGKTAAFALPILHQIKDGPPGRLRALVLVPTRELAVQVARNFTEYAKRLPVRVGTVYGGVPAGPQEMMLRHGVDVLVATPGRLKDHLWKGLIDFGQTRFLVLDEADRMLDMGFIDDVREIVNLIPAERQTMLFSATLAPEIRRLAKDLLSDPVRVEVAPPATAADGVEHQWIDVERGDKRRVLERLLRGQGMERTLIFTRTRHGTRQLASQLQRSGHRVTSLHSDKTQAERTAALEAFRAGRSDLLVATDIAARGLDVEGVTHVINYDLPRSAEDYVHRIGRTARAGDKGIAISLVTPEDRRVAHAIEQSMSRNGRGNSPRPEEERGGLPAGATGPRRSYERRDLRDLERPDASARGRGRRAALDAVPARGREDERAGRLEPADRAARRGSDRSDRARSDRGSDRSPRSRSDRSPRPTSGSSDRSRSDRSSDRPRSRSDRSAGPASERSARPASDRSARRPSDRSDRRVAEGRSAARRVPAERCEERVPERSAASESRLTSLLKLLGFPRASS